MSLSLWDYSGTWTLLIRVRKLGDGQAGTLKTSFLLSFLLVEDLKWQVATHLAERLHFITITQRFDSCREADSTRPPRRSGVRN